MKSIQVTDDVHQKLQVLKGVLVKKNPSEVILLLMHVRQYDDAFFERIKEKIPDE